MATKRGEKMKREDIQVFRDIQKNAELSVKLLRPDILIDIPMNRYDTFDFDKYDRLAGIGRAKTKKAIERWLQAK